MHNEMSAKKSIGEINYFQAFLWKNQECEPYSADAWALKTAKKNQVVPQQDVTSHPSRQPSPVT